MVLGKTVKRYAVVHRVVLGLILVTVACGESTKPVLPDGSIVDAPPPDANPSDQIAAAKKAMGTTGHSLPISYAVVTYLKPPIGNLINDPAGFTIQAEKLGPAMFVEVDPTQTTPPLARGDIISFTINELRVVGLQKRAAQISNLVRYARGFDVTTLSQEVSSASDLVTNIDNYDSELVDATGSIATFQPSGPGFWSAQVATAGMSPSESFVVRFPYELPDAIDLVPTCWVTIHDTPVGKFYWGTVETQLAAFTPGDLSLTSCPPPTVVSAVDIGATQVRVTFDRYIAPASVAANGSQFTFTNGLVASGATASGRTVIVTTGTQASGTTYAVAVASTVTDQQGSGVAAPTTATFLGFDVPASVRINEVGANIDDGCDLIELRVLAGGSLRGIRVQERTGGAFADLVHDLPRIAVAKNDIIVLHLDAADPNCNPGASTNETVKIDERSSTSFARNYDTAWDLFSDDTGLVATDNVITVFDRYGVMRDVVFFDDDLAPTVANPNIVATDTELAATDAAAAGMWLMVGGGIPATGYIDDDFRLHAVLDANSPLSTSHQGSDSESMRRIDNTDDNNKADWAQGENTFGRINAGQSPIP